MTITRSWGYRGRPPTRRSRTAYRRLAMQHHPDRNPDHKEESEERFKEITEAYSVLGRPAEARGLRPLRTCRRGGGGGAPDFNSTIFSDFEDIFGDLFGIGDVFGPDRPHDAAVARAGLICATTWKSAWKRPRRACKPKSRFRDGRPVMPATERAPSREANPSTAPPAAGAGNFGTSRDSLPSPALARNAKGWAR